MENILKQIAFTLCRIACLLAIVFIFLLSTTWLRQIDPSDMLRAMLLVLGMTTAGWWHGSTRKVIPECESCKVFVRQNWLVCFLWVTICFAMMLNIFHTSEYFYLVLKVCFGVDLAKIICAAFGSVTGFSILCYGIAYLLGRIHQQTHKKQN